MRRQNRRSTFIVENFDLRFHLPTFKPPPKAWREMQSRSKNIAPKALSVPDIASDPVRRPWHCRCRWRPVFHRRGRNLHLSHHASAHRAPAPVQRPTAAFKADKATKYPQSCNADEGTNLNYAAILATTFWQPAYYSISFILLHILLLLIISPHIYYFIINLIKSSGGSGILPLSEAYAM